MSSNVFGTEMRRLRKEAGLTLSDVADTLGVSIAYVSSVETGVKRPLDKRGINLFLARIKKQSLYLFMASRAMYDKMESVRKRLEREYYDEPSKK